ncbi:hypothetical protein [Amycolatopsis sp. CA-230715]|uniref:hypothetical protein n=1 Tax=Amycolatopsis sp. CA-230715 TaxID=2745196 RepID=UPI001C022414|nr:hypothetical protein [Amycolatopsis sp. CA-230715]
MLPVVPSIPVSVLREGGVVPLSSKSPPRKPRTVDEVAMAAVQDAPDPDEALRLLWDNADGFLGEMLARRSKRWPARQE